MIGPIAAFLAMISWSISPIAYKYLVERYDPIMVNAIRITFTLPVLIPLLASERTVFVREDEFLILIALAIIGPGIADTLFIKSLELIGASIATPISYTYVLFVDIVAIFIFNEEATYNILLGSLLVIVGASVLSKGENKSTNAALGLGVALAVLAAISWTFSITLLKIALTTTSPVLITFYRTLIIMIILDAYVILKGRYRILRGVSAFEALVGMIGGASGIGFGLILYLIAIEYLGIAQATVVVSGSIMITELLAALISKERLGLIKYLGALLISIGIYMASI